MSSRAKKAVSAIENCGACLVFPIDNRKEPVSLWSALHPRTKMRWEWDEGGDNRVAQLWHLRGELSQSGLAVYTKWYRGRATFFSLPVYRDLLAFFGTPHRPRPSSGAARDLLNALEDRSPLSTKQLKKATDLVGRDNERSYTRGLRSLWEHGWIVAWGEFDDGAFPSLGIGATSLLFEGLWNEARELDPNEARTRLVEKLGATNPFWKFALHCR